MLFHALYRLLFLIFCSFLLFPHLFMCIPRRISTTTRSPPDLTDIFLRSRSTLFCLISVYFHISVFAFPVAFTHHVLCYLHSPIRYFRTRNLETWSSTTSSIRDEMEGVERSDVVDHSLDDLRPGHVILAQHTMTGRAVISAKAD